MLLKLIKKYSQNREAKKKLKKERQAELLRQEEEAWQRKISQPPKIYRIYFEDGTQFIGRFVYCEAKRNYRCGDGWSETYYTLKSMAAPNEEYPEVLNFRTDYRVKMITQLN